MDPNWKNKNFSFYQNSKCEFFPCHKMDNTADFNCLFCYCPLYALGENCGGNFRFNKKGYKDCTNCTLPHQRDNYGYVNEKFQEIATLIRKNRDDSQE